VVGCFFLWLFWGFKSPLSCVDEGCFASTLVALLVGPGWLQLGRRRPVVECGTFGCAAGGRIATKKILGYCRGRWAKLDGEHLWPSLILLRKPVLMENRVLGLAWSCSGGCPQGVHVWPWWGDTGLRHSGAM